MTEAFNMCSSKSRFVAQDFFDVELLQSQKGFHTMHMKEFLEKEGVTGGLHGILPPHNRSDIWGNALWSYLNKVFDLSYN